MRAAALVRKDLLRRVAASNSTYTNIDAPAHLVRGMWTVDQIPPERLIAPLVVLDVTAQARAFRLPIRGRRRNIASGSPLARSILRR